MKEKLSNSIESVNNRLPERWSFSGPLLFIRSNFGVDFINTLAEDYPRFWKYWGWLGVGVFVMLLFAMGLFVVHSAIAILQQPDLLSSAGSVFGRESVVPLASEVSNVGVSELTNPKNYLVIPGVNEFLPASVTLEILAALTVAMLIHEFGHGIYCRVADIDVKSTGLLLLGGLIPLGAFVEPDEEAVETESPRKLLPMFSAGVMNNLALTLVAFIVLCGLLSVGVSSAPGEQSSQEESNPIQEFPYSAITLIAP